MPSYEIKAYMANQIVRFKALHCFQELTLVNITIAS
jgi:hypothetical protein